jgi:hypothetical protein
VVILKAFALKSLMSVQYSWAQAALYLCRAQPVLQTGRINRYSVLNFSKPQSQAKGVNKWMIPGESQDFPNRKIAQIHLQTFP